MPHARLGLRLAGALALACCAAQAQTAGPDVLYGNTLHVQKAVLALDFYYDADGTFTNSAGLHGTWTYESDQLCVTYETGGAGACMAFEANHAIGESWSQTDTDGDVVTLSILPGRSGA
jgi:hypothetical protein